MFLDRDGTINAEKGYLFRIEDFEFLPGVIEALKLLQGLGFLLIIITNQSGIARGYYKEEDYNKLNRWMLNELQNKDIHIDGVYYCPHHPNAVIKEYKVECTCRKPKLALYERAIREHQLDINQCYAIGDKIRDCHICEVTDCRGYLIGNNEEPDVIEAVRNGDVQNVRYAANLLESVRLIKNNGL